MGSQSIAVGKSKPSVSGSDLLAGAFGHGSFTWWQIRRQRKQVGTREKFKSWPISRLIPYPGFLNGLSLQDGIPMLANGHRPARDISDSNLRGMLFSTRSDVSVVSFFAFHCENGIKSRPMRLCIKYAVQNSMETRKNS